MATAWSLDFCLVCDRQTLGGAYCSQACRLAEMDGCATTAADSEPSSPTTTTPVASPWTAQGYQHQHQHQQPSALYLGPAIDFSGYKFPGSSSSSSSSSSTPSMPSASRQRLSPSSSQTSLSSLHSVSSNSSSLSGQARSELENYSGSFDKVRDWKRRRTAS
ncbi:uncharacterized protein BDCG_01378 [Blastomyces dermatitidis ER-3]|uniref:Life-span regulatory factor domain-containing protein n=1 Tax=Ajellomyces dermatitidis (strain ER-3 / ATCC MYA-2586) TaxID=559297 RepID=A0ABP2EU46_AJEDR|nr:uncharacterized protein BDCG_01378 [Blastomyces dermatitidis ER-3]EEQ86258.1 hypothetical protein BDCG_01378 [Blastomyces dermatitidis ER-3]